MHAAADCECLDAAPQLGRGGRGGRDGLLRLLRISSRAAAAHGRCDRGRDDGIHRRRDFGRTPPGAAARGDGPRRGHLGVGLDRRGDARGLGGDDCTAFGMVGGVFRVGGAGLERGLETLDAVGVWIVL